MTRCEKYGCMKEGGWRDFPTHQAINMDGFRHDLCPSHFGEYKGWSLETGRRLSPDQARQTRVHSSHAVRDNQDMQVYWLGDQDWKSLQNWFYVRGNLQRRGPTESM